MSAPYREVSSRLKRLLSEGGVIEGSLYRADRGNTPRHQLSDRATGRFRNIYVAPLVADWSARWAEAKRLLKEMSELAREELVAAITERTGRKTVARASAPAGGPRKRRTAKRLSKS